MSKLIILLFSYYTRQDQEMKRQIEQEKQLERQRQIEMEKEEQRRKLLEQKEVSYLPSTFCDCWPSVR